jgi:hypothetical protein
MGKGTRAHIAKPTANAVAIPDRIMLIHGNVNCSRSDSASSAINAKAIEPNNIQRYGNSSILA